jgi:hypothetical protein
VENPIIRRAIGLCEEQGMKVVYHPDTVEVWFSPTNKRFYTVWSQFLADAETIFGDQLHNQTGAAAARNGFGTRGDAAAAARPPRADATGEPDAAMAAELATLKREMKILERAIRVVGMQRDEWKKEADTLRDEVESSRAEMTSILQSNASLMAAAGGVDRYKMVRQIIVRRLHPDVAGTDEEKAHREKLFKTIWKEIEALDKKV